MARMAAWLAGIAAVACAASAFAAGTHHNMKWDDTVPPRDAAGQHVQVSGDANALKAFHRELQMQFRITNLEDASIACVGCGLLQQQASAAAAQPAASQLDYYYAKMLKDRKGYFDKAKANVGAGVTLKYDDDMSGMGNNACPVSPPAPSGCVSAPYCISTNGCNRSPALPCRPCVAP